MQWKTADELEIFGQSWRTESEEKALIALVHGFGEHSGRYGHVAEAFNKRGYSVFAFDHRGHGKSAGQRGHTPDYEHLLRDLDIFLDMARDLFPGTPIILYGHSMGGNIVTNYVISRAPDILGAVVTGPFYRTAEPPPAFQMMLGRMMNKIWGAFPDRAKLDANHISRDVEVVKKYVDDPMVHDKISARMGLSLIEYGQYAVDHAAEVNMPFFILHGGEDYLTDCEASRDFKARAGENVVLEVLDGFYHEIHNDPGKEHVISKIIDFCDSLTNKPG
jgi:alpha-beta hydrolase superfamily lysophospholipase